MQNITSDKVIEVETFSWMQSIKAVNTNKNYYMIGQVKARANTLLVTEVRGNGGAVMFCQTHKFAYPIKGTCEECRNAVVTVPDEDSVTARNTP